MLVRQDYTIVEKYMDMLLCPQEALSTTLIERRYLRCPMTHTSVEHNSDLVAAVKQVQATAIFLYQDHIFNQAIDLCVWTIEVFAKVESNFLIAQIESQIEAAIALVKLPRST